MMMSDKEQLENLVDSKFEDLLKDSSGITILQETNSN